jgi:putative PIN family toxin of toxin-antitoxin system
MKETDIKVIFDTNVWISFLIGKRLAFIKGFIVDGKFTIVITEQLLEEIKEVTNREGSRNIFHKKV